ncbi:MAG TPA: tripartite tricarboxylate transporter substrate binding protein [Xanthobacteraceae bacterium]|nr:tripartite tricarboxylate transporter substrate binding protein [Xanthobacteraceae bacterium]
MSAWRTLLAALALAFALPADAGAQAYPNRPITLVIPLPPGGTNSIMARAVADKLSELLGQQVVVENRASGGSGTVGTRQVAKSAPDGYTLLLGYTSNLATAPSMYRDIGYDPRRDFAPVGLIAAASGLLLVHPSVTAKNVSELIAMMKSSPEPYQVGQPGTGTVNHLASELFALQAGVKVQQIPYKGSQPLITDLAGGHVKVGFNPIPVSRGALDSGLIRALASTAAKRSTLLPDVPTLAESGLPGFDATLYYGLVAPAGTPRAIVERLNKELQTVLGFDDVRRRIFNEGGEPMPTTPEEHAALIDRDETKWANLIRSIGLKAE